LSGELLSLFSALLWAITSVLLTVGAKRLDVVPLNLVRCTVSTVFFLALLPFFGGLQALAALTPSNWLWLTVSVLALLVVGDTLYFLSMDLAGVSWTMPLSSISPLWAVLLAAVFLGEPLSWSLLAGALLVVLGTVLVSRSAGPVGTVAPEGPARAAVMPAPLELHNEGIRSASGASSDSWRAKQRASTGRVTLPGDRRRGLLLALLVSVIWAAGAVSIKPGADGLHSVVANSVRQPLALLILLAFTLLRGQWRELRRVDAKSWRIIIVASLMGTGIGSLVFVMAVQLAGAGRSSVLMATSPLLAIPFSMLWLQERPTRWTLAGTVLTAAGIAMVV
jgi:transporter family protein